MTRAPTASLLALMVLTSVLAASGAAKLRSPLAFDDAFVALRVPPLLPRRAAARTLPWLELVLAVLLMASSGPLLVGATGVLVLLMLVYTWVIVRALGFDEPVDCACFGSLGSQVVSRLTLARNLLLLMLSLTAIWIAAAGGSAPDAIGELRAADWRTLAAALTAVAVAVTIVARPGADGADQVGDRELDYERRPIPYGVLMTTDGTSATLAELAATRARLLVVLNPHCGPCVRTAEKLDGWAGQLEPAVGIIAVHPEAGLELPHDEVVAMVEPAHNVRRIFSVGAPGAVLLGADGLMAGGPVAGEGDVERFVEDIVSELAKSSM